MKRLLVALLALVLFVGIGGPAFDVAGPEYPPDGESVPGDPIDDIYPGEPGDEPDPGDPDDEPDPGRVPFPGPGMT